MLYGMRPKTRSFDSRLLLVAVSRAPFPLQSLRPLSSHLAVTVVRLALLAVDVVVYFLMIPCAVPSSQKVSVNSRVRKSQRFRILKFFT